MRLVSSSRDQLRQVIGQKLASIVPPVLSGSYDFPFHPVFPPLEIGTPIPDTFVVELLIQPASVNALYLTESGMAFRRTIGGTKKLSGAELIASLVGQLQHKITNQGLDPSETEVSLKWMPSVAARAQVVRPLVQRARVLWVDDNPTSTVYERRFLSAMGIQVDPVLSTEEAIVFARGYAYDLVISDMKRGTDQEAGLKLLDEPAFGSLRQKVVFYVGVLDKSRSIPQGAFAITNRPDELLHYAMDVLERRKLPAR